jgi:DNA-binding transcriptional LysR family regulator
MPYQSDRALEELAAFVAVVEANGFTAASRSLGARKATLSQRLSNLEGRLGVRLLVRTTRSIRLTDEGRVYFEHARRALAAVRDAEASVASAESQPSGVLRLSIPTSMADALFDGVVAPYMARHPDVAVHLDASMRRIDLVQEGFHLAVRLGPLEDSELIVRRLGVTTGGYYASPSYLQRCGTPAHPKELVNHRVIAVPRSSEPVTWDFVLNGKRRSVVVRTRLLVNNLELAARAAAAGFGIARTPRHFIQPFLNSHRVVRILREWSPPDAEVFAVMPPGGPLVPKTRVFVDMLVAWFEQEKLAGHPKGVWRPRGPPRMPRASQSGPRGQRGG